MNISEIIKSYLLEKDEGKAYALLGKNVEAIREALSQGGGESWHFTQKELEIINSEPARIATLYEIVFPEGEGVQGDERSIEKEIEEFEAGTRAEIISAFEEIATVLPDQLTQWDRWFSEVEESDLYEHSALTAPGTAAMGLHSQKLAKFGLTPEIIAEALNGFALLFSYVERKKQQRQHEKPCFVLHSPHGQLLVGAAELIQFASETPGLPEGVAPPSLIDWVLESLKVLPFLVPGYEVTQQDDGPPHVKRCEMMSLSACWTRRAFETVEEFAAYY